MNTVKVHPVVRTVTVNVDSCVHTFVNISQKFTWQSLTVHHISLKLITSTMDTSLTLNNGTKMPLLGFGTWQSKPGQVEAAVELALR